MKGVTSLLAAGAIVASAAAQEVKIVGSGGYGMEALYTKAYDKSRQITYTGRVSGKVVAAPESGMSESVSLVLKTPNGGTSHVELGPSWYVASQVADIDIGDKVKVIGSKVKMGDGYVVLARQVVAPDGEVLTMRDLGGAPYWAYNRTGVTLPTRIPASAVRGKVVRRNTFNRDGVVYGGYEVQTDNGLVNVLTAPEWYDRRQDFAFSPGNYITVVGEGVSVPAGPYTVVADTIYGPGAAIILTQNGVPFYQNFGPVPVIRN
jgi:hypothetical protein